MNDLTTNLTAAAISEQSAANVKNSSARVSAETNKAKTAAAVITKQKAMKTYHILNLGAGVQSTALYLMFMRGEVKDAQGEPIQLDAAIFGDTQDESALTYRHLEWMKSLNGPPILVRTKGKLSDALRDGCGASNRCASIPAYVRKSSHIEGDKPSIILRQCTAEYKIAVVEKAIKQEVLGLTKGQRIPKDVHIVEYFGLSYEESRRVMRVMAQFVKINWASCKFPLVEAGMSRKRCSEYLADKVPHIVTRSACVYCPFHDNKEWLRIKTQEPDSFTDAVRVDAMIREPGSRCASGLHGTLYLHKSMIPLGEVDFAALVADEQDEGGQQYFDCMGMCDT
jgi:hypothetical protein